MMIDHHREGIMRKGYAALGALILALATASAGAQTPAPPKLDQRCTVSVLNRNVQVKPDGTWILPNIPANFGPVRARVTCIIDGQTISGESELFTIPPSGSVNVPRIILGQTTPIPSSVTISAPAPSLDHVGATLQLAVSAAYSNRPSSDVTAASTGTRYTISNPAIASITGNGLVQALRSGTVIVQATQEGTSGMFAVQIVLAGNDSDGDGIPDDAELRENMDPNNPNDALEDPDRDGLTNRQEYERGTDRVNADTDRDGLDDGREVGLGTSPLLRDTDGDGISDGLEVQTGSNPLDPNNFNLAAALRTVSVSPPDFLLTFNTISGEAFRQLAVAGTLLDGTSIDLTSTERGTNYSSSDLDVCNFGGTDGRIFAGISGSCTITVTVAGFTGIARGTVRTVAPTALSYVSIPGFANSVDVNGDYAYVAAGSAGLQVVDVSDRSAPRIVAALGLPGNANDVKLAGTHAFVAAGAMGLHIVDISNPLTPRLVGSVNTPGDAYDVRPLGTLAFVADGSAGLQIVDVSNVAAPRIVGSVDTPGTAKGVDVSGQTAVVADGFGGLKIIDVSNPASPAIVGSVALPDEARDVAVNGTVAYVADYQGSLQVVGFSTPTAPVILGSTSQTLGGILMDVAVSGNFAFGADVLFVNGVPIVDVSVATNPVVRSRLDFTNFRDDNGTGIAVDGVWAYMTASRGIVENGTSENTRLYIGQYRGFEDVAGVAPAVTILSPAAGSEFIEGAPIPITVSATDDVAVTRVNFLVNGTVVATDTGSPYTFTLPAPQGVSSLTIGATAVDLGGNVGTAEIIVTIAPDPRTTVTATVVNAEGQPVEGAVVTITGGRSGTTAADGTVSVPGVPTILGPIQATAAFVAPDGTIFSASSGAVAPVPNGVTPLGTLTLGRAFTYYGHNPDDNGRLTLVGWAESTQYKVVALGTLPIVVTSGTINRSEILSIPMASVRQFKVESSSPLLATLGFDDGGNIGGSFFYPATDGRSFVGREFVLQAPILSVNNELAIFAYETSGVTIRDAAGAVVTTQTVLANGYYAVSGAPLSPGTVYRIESTGNIAIQSNALDAHTVVPSSDGGEVGTAFLFGLRGSRVVMAFAYERATITAVNLDTGQQAFQDTIFPGQFSFFNDFSATRLKITSTGRIGVWAGSTDDGSIVDLADNLTINRGRGGQDLLIRTQREGAVLFAAHDNTLVNVMREPPGGGGGEGSPQVSVRALPAPSAAAAAGDPTVPNANGFTIATLNAGQFLELETDSFLRVVSDKPVLIETVTGDPLDSWETALKLVVVSPPDVDHDHDGLPDTVEVRIGLSPVNPDTDGNGINDAEDDADGDGLSNAAEIARGTDPRNPDTDGDGLLDGEDDDPLTVETVAPEVDITSPSAGSTLIEGQTIHIELNATDNAEVVSVRVLVNGAYVGIIAPGFYEYSFTVPYALTTLTISASAEDVAGNVGTAQPLVVSVAPDPLTTVQGTVVDDTGAPVAGAQVFVTFGGLKGEFFNFDTPLTEMPDLTGRAPDGVRRVSAINFRNPDNVLSPDTFGVSLAPHYAARFVGQIDIPAPGTYTFTLGADDGARLIIRGAEVVTVNGTADFTEASNAVNLPAGRHPIEIQYFQNTGDAELRLSYSRFGGIQEIVPPDRLLGGDGGDFRAVTNEAGEFSIAGVPTILGDLSISATATVEGEELSGGLSGLAPDPAGTTDAGAIVVTALQFDTNFGESIPMYDDWSVQRSLPFAFPFFGETHTSIKVNTNGNITFGPTFEDPDYDYTESLQEFASYPRISPFWDDLINGTVYVNDQIPGRFVVTWYHLQEYCCYGDNTIQMTLFSDGRIAFVYNGLTARDAIVGISPGGGSAATVQVVDFSAGPVTSNPASAVAEQFAANPFDLDRHFLVVTPKPAGGYDFVVRPLSPPPSGIPASAFMVPGARLELWPPAPPR